MKYVTFILSVYFSLLSFIPCADAETIPVGGTTQSGDRHSHEDDRCSPFCICSCCGVQILNFSQPVLFNFVAVSQTIATLAPSYKTVFASNFYGTIWQPPQLV